MDDGDDCFMFQKDSMRLTFMVWDCDVRNVVVGCCPVVSATVYVIVHYADPRAQITLLKGAEWTDSHSRLARAALPQTAGWLGRIPIGAGVVRVGVGWPCGLVSAADLGV